MNHQPSKQWAYRIIELWDKGEYPEKHEFAYLRACKEVGQEPKKHPDRIRKTNFRVDVDG